MTDEHRLSDFTSRCGAFPPGTSVRVDRYGTDEAVVAGIVIPVHEQGSIISDVLTRLTTRARLAHEVIVVVDGCRDTTLGEVRTWALHHATRGTTRRVIVADIHDGVFETMSDTVGIALATAEWILEVQADVFMDEDGWDLVLVEALRRLPEVFCLSGRGAHRVEQVPGGVRSRARSLASRASRPLLTRQRNYRPRALEYRLTNQIGRCGELIDKMMAIPIDRHVYLHDTAMRGPLAFKKATFDALDGFDTERFFLGDDDHDLFARAQTHLGLRVGYLPIAFRSPLELGSTRRKRSDAEQARFEALKQHYSDAANSSHLRSGAVVADLPRRRYSLDSL